MENLVFTQLSIPEIRKLFRQEIEEYFELKQKSKKSREQYDKFLTVQQAANFLNLTLSTIYSKVSKGELPVMKRSKLLYFSCIELTEYLKKGRKKSNSEIEAEAQTYLSNTKKH